MTTTTKERLKGTAAGFDFSARMDTTGFARMMVLDPLGMPARDDQGNEVWIEFDGADSDTYQKAQREAINRRVHKDNGRLTMEDAEEEAIHILARCTRRWSDNVALDGELLPCTYENAKRLFTRIKPVREQADRFVRTRANFMPAPSRGS